MIDPDTDAIVATLEGRSRQPDRAQSRDGQALRLGQHRHRSVGDRSRDGASTIIRAGTEGNALSVNVKANEIYFVGYQDNFLTIVDGATNGRRA